MPKWPKDTKVQGFHYATYIKTPDIHTYQNPLGNPDELQFIIQGDKILVTHKVEQTAHTIQNILKFHQLNLQTNHLTTN